MPTQTDSLSPAQKLLGELRAAGCEFSLAIFYGNLVAPFGVEKVRRALETYQELAQKGVELHALEIILRGFRHGAFRPIESDLAVGAPGLSPAHGSMAQNRADGLGSSSSLAP